MKLLFLSSSTNLEIVFEKELLKKRIYIKHKNKFNVPIFSMNTKKAINCILQNLKKNKNFLID